MGRWSRLVAAGLVQFSAISKSGSVLDVGSETGALAVSIARIARRCEVVGIEPSKEHVAYANAINPYPGRVRFEVGDAQEMSFPDASFAACLSLLLFNFIPDPAKALREVRRITAPGGRIAAVVWDYGGVIQMHHLFRDAAATIDPQRAEQADEKHLRLCRLGELMQLWKDAGLAECLRGFLGAVPAGVQALREEVRRKLPGAGRPFTLTARVWAVRGSVAAAESRSGRR